MSREERIENIRFQGGMNVMLNVLERLEKAEERITELYGRINALTFELDICKASESRRKVGCIDEGIYEKGEIHGISDERQIGK